MQLWIVLRSAKFGVLPTCGMFQELIGIGESFVQRPERGQQEHYAAHRQGNFVGAVCAPFPFRAPAYLLIETKEIVDLARDDS